MTRCVAICALMSAVIVTPAFAEKEFDSIIRDMESHYGSKKMYIPMLGVANFFVKIARPAGTSDLKLAIFENIDGSRHPSPEELSRTLQPRGWKPFVRVQAARKGEHVQVYARQSNRDHELLITTFERNEAIVVRVRVNPEGLARWVNNPAAMCRSKGWSHSD